MDSIISNSVYGGSAPADQQSESTLLTGLEDAACPLCGAKDSAAERTVGGYELEKCGDCDMVFMNPRCTPSHLEEIYTVRDEDAMIELYSKIASEDVIKRYHAKLEKVEKLAGGTGKLLDYACAAGYFYEVAQQRGWDATGYDIGLWTKKAAEKRSLSKMVVGPDFDNYFEENSFDVVYAAQVFEHLLIPADYLKQLLRVLKPGGLLYIDVPNYHTLPIMANKDDFMLNDPPQHVNFFTPSTLKKLAVEGGLEDVNLFSDAGLKWENFFGRPIDSGIASAYGLIDEDDPVAKASAMSRAKRGAKELIKTSIVNPLLYDKMKVGMTLAVTGRKPA